MDNLSIYQFLGFKIVRVDLNRETEGKVEKFSIQLADTYYNDKENIYTILINVKIVFEGCNETKFTFVSGYQIIDKKWFVETEKNVVDSLFISVVFPFIREKINNICDDSRGAFIIPIIDFRNINVNNEIVFSLINK